MVVVGRRRSEAAPSAFVVLVLPIVMPVKQQHADEIHDEPDHGDGEGAPEIDRVGVKQTPDGLTTMTVATRPSAAALVYPASACTFPVPEVKAR